jgi:hypothetical protein
MKLGNAKYIANKQNKQIATILVLEKLSIVFKYRIILVTGII